MATAFHHKFNVNKVQSLRSDKLQQPICSQMKCRVNFRFQRRITMLKRDNSRNFRVSNSASDFNQSKGIITVEDFDINPETPDEPVIFQNMIYGDDSGPAKDALDSRQESYGDGMDDLSDYLEQLHDFHVKLEAMVENGDRETVSTLVAANFEDLVQQLNQGTKNMEHVAMIDVLIQLSMSLGDIEGVKKMLSKMKDILLTMKGNEPLLDAFLERMGTLYFTFGNKEAAILFFQRSLDLQESHLGKNSPKLVSTLLGLAGTYTEIEKRKGTYMRIISILENAKGTKCEELGTPLLHLGYTLLEEENPEEAEFHFRRALNIAEENNIKGGGSIGIATCALARVKYAKGDLSKAAELYQSGLRMLRSSGYWSEGDIELENIQMEVAEFYSVTGMSKEAQELWEDVLHEKEKIVGMNSPRLVVYLQNLATSYAQDGKYDKCEPLLRRSLKLVTASLGPTAPQVSIPLAFLATTLHHLNQNREAEALARQTLNIRENNFPDDDPLIGEACHLLASILHANMKSNEALKYANKALHIKEKNSDSSNDMEVAGTLDLTLEIMDSLGKMDEAFPILNKLELLLAKSNKESR